MARAPGKGQARFRDNYPVMQIRSSLLLFSLVAVIVTMLVAAAMTYIHVQVGDGIRRNDLVGVLSTDTAELANITSDYLLYREKRSVRQWRNKYRTLGNSLRTLQEELEDVGAMNRLQRYYGEAGRSFESLLAVGTNMERERQLASQLFFMILELQNEARAIRVFVSNRMEEHNRILLLASHTAVGMLALMALFGLHFAYRKVVKPLTTMEKAVRQGLRGDAMISMPIERQDELGRLAGAFVEMVENERITSEALKAANRELENFNFVAGHDLQEPLRIILNYAGMLEEDLGQNISPDVREDLHFVQESAARMRSLIRDLLAYTRTRSAQMIRQTVELDDYLDEVLWRLDPLIEECKARITREKLPRIQGDPSLITSALLHVVGNAVKFHRPGESPEVAVSAVETESAWEVRVADNGIGIEPHHREMIFVPFKRLNRRKDYEGSGIGLAIVQETMKRHGGIVRVEGVLPHGSVFILSFPKQEFEVRDAK